eukprot:8153369-Pyramimonas_sp.AAC.1
MQSLCGVFQWVPVARYFVALFKGSLLRGRPIKPVRFLAKGSRSFVPTEYFWGAFQRIPIMIASNKLRVARQRFPNDPCCKAIHWNSRVVFRTVFQARG